MKKILLTVALLAAFDAQSAYSSNYSDHTVTNGTEPCEGGSITLSKRIANYMLLREHFMRAKK